MRFQSRRSRWHRESRWPWHNGRSLRVSRLRVSAPAEAVESHAREEGRIAGMALLQSGLQVPELF